MILIAQAFGAPHISHLATRAGLIKVHLAHVHSAPLAAAGDEAVGGDTDEGASADANAGAVAGGAPKDAYMG